MAGERSGGLDPKAVLSLYRDDQIIHMIPSVDFEEQRRFRAGSQSSAMIDYFAAHIYGDGGKGTDG